MFLLFRQLNSTRSLKRKLVYQTQVHMYIFQIYIYVNRIKDFITKNKKIIQSKKI